MGQVSSGTRGNYSLEDRDIFRPIQYCSVYFAKMAEDADGDWFSREVIHMASLHIESLVLRIGLAHRIPLGRAIHAKVFKGKVDRRTWMLLDRFRHIYNDAKHNVSQPKDAHLFSQEDAVLAYVVCRRLGIELRPLVTSLCTDWAESDSSDGEDSAASK